MDMSGLARFLFWVIAIWGGGWLLVAAVQVARGGLVWVPSEHGTAWADLSTWIGWVQVLVHVFCIAVVGILCYRGGYANRRR
jgi:hypothetical protein